ncbi:uncharacterized protein LOC142380621 [Odontesthes bonariensis]|uniref:uncharacterized protein LOC142380621 n=1 Tax=Odontesthes bonariensis TaxID=219752 RepID=UPI003F584CAE
MAGKGPEEVTGKGPEEMAEFPLISIMTPTSVTSVGGVVIVTRVIPKDDSSVLLQTPSDKAPPPAAKAPPTKEDSKAAAFLRAEPQGLGVAQIFIGLLFVLLSLTAIFSPTLIHFAPLGLAVVFVASGSLAVASGRRTSVALVWASLLSNVLSILLGLAGLTYIGLLFAAELPSVLICGPRTVSDYRYGSCSYRLQDLDRIHFGLLGLGLVLLVLQVCVSVGVCVFSGKVIRKHRRSSPITVVADDGTLLCAAGSELDGMGDLHAQSP